MNGTKLALLIVGGVIAFLLVVALGFGLWVRGAYNGFVDREEAVDSQWAQVETQYQRRYDLIPNLVASVQGIFEQERAVFEAIAEARTRYANAQASGSTEEQVEATVQVESALSRLLVIIENYPELRSQQNVTQLMDELAGTENRISVERRRFNDATLEYNRSTRRFPGNVVAGMFGFDQRPYFESTEGADVPPPVEFQIQ